MIQGKSVSLILESSHNEIVAHGIVVSMRGMTKTQSDKIPKDCTCVSIDVAVDPNALLPYPIPNVCDNIGDAVGSHVVWPTHLVMIKEKVMINFSK